MRFFKPDVRADVDDELRFHLEARVAEYEGRGVPRADAVRLARDRFGDPETVRHALETHDLARQRRRDRREYVDQFLHDIRIALRSLRRTPAFTLTVLATLALGIGATTSVFSVVARELIDPLPYHDGARLVLLYSTSPHQTFPFVSPREIDQLQRSSHSLASIAAFGRYMGYTYVGERETLGWQGASVGPNFFQTLGVQPEIGRLIDARDLEGGPAPVVVLSHVAWIQAFGGDRGVVGRTIRLNDAQWTVIGVTRPDFACPAPSRAPQVWTPLDPREALGTPAEDRRLLQAIGRMADTTELSATQAEMRVFGDRAAAAGQASGLGPLSLTAVPVRDAIVGRVRPVLLVIMGAALLVLVLASVNVAGLFLARATARAREMAVRAALGAARWRIARQLLTEAMLLGLIGGGLGILLAYWGRTILVNLGGRALPATGGGLDRCTGPRVCVPDLGGGWHRLRPDASPDRDPTRLDSAARRREPLSHRRSDRCADRTGARRGTDGGRGSPARGGRPVRPHPLRAGAQIPRFRREQARPVGPPGAPEVVRDAECAIAIL